jgi:hypothetical protein
MPKIENWSKRSKNVWINDSNSEVVKLNKISDLEGWAFMHQSSLERRAQNYEVKKGFNTRNDAREYAVNWMKNHPNP